MKMCKFVKRNEGIKKARCDDGNINPEIEALKISIIYGLIGFMWIFSSDSIISIFINDLSFYKYAQIYKGCIFVALSSVIIYILIQSKISIIQCEIKKNHQSYEELSAAHQQLIAIEEELRDQYNELEKNKNALLRSEQRYELAVEGANNGIWDWDLIKEEYYFSLSLKESFGYKEGELPNKIEVWQSLIHPEDKEIAIKILNDYLKHPINTYKNTYRIRTKNGSYRWILSNGKALRD